MLIFIAMLLLGLLILLGTLTWVMSQMLIAPSRMTDGKAIHLLKRLSPGDLSMAFSDVTFTVRDEQTKRQLKLKGWWIPAPARTVGSAPLPRYSVGEGRGEGSFAAGKQLREQKNPHPSPLPEYWAREPEGTCDGLAAPASSGHTVILLHGFADAKVGALAWAPMWQSLGYNILAIDLRAHGESEGKYTSAGYFERLDVDQVINDLRTSKPAETKHLVLFGISLGAAVAAAVATMRDDLDAVILDSPYHDYAFAARQHGRYMNLPFGFLSPLAIRLGQWRSGAKFAEVAPLKSIRRTKAPMLIFLGDLDPLVDNSQFKPLLECGVEVVRIPEAGHVLGIVADPMEYRDQVWALLNCTE